MERKKNKDSQAVKISKAASFLLRHGAAKEGIPIRPDGFVLVEDLLAFLNRNYKANLETVKAMVENCQKRRFQFQDGTYKYIRATQGHSMVEQIDTQLLLQQIKDPTECPVVVHGTYLKVWQAILKGGLDRMSRKHIHFAPGLKKDKVISGMRGNCELYIYLDIEMAMKDGIKFYKSSNQVILSEGVDGRIDSKYFKYVETSKGVRLLQDGKLIE